MARSSRFQFLTSFLLPFLTLTPTLTQAQIHIISPKTLKDQFKNTLGTVYGTTATFGAPYFGNRVLGKLLYGESKGKNHCEESDYSVPKPTDGSNLLSVVIVRRGDCTFAQKVLVAEKNKDASAVIIVDKETSTKTAEQIQATIMADDDRSTGAAVKIPSILISHYEGDKLIEAARKADEDGESVVVKLAWDIPQSNQVMVDFWFSSGSREANNFLREFRHIAEQFKESMSFVPHYSIISLPEDTDTASLCLEWDGVDGVVEGMKESDKNKFCAADPDGPGGATGRMVVEENLRQLCIFKTSEKWKNPDVKKSGELFGYSEAFWKYVGSFWKQCTDEGRDFKLFRKSCSDQVMDQHGIDKGAVSDCLKNDGRDLLVKELRNRAWSPLAMRINGWRYSGPIESNLVTRSVCGGYLKRPSQCDDYQVLTRYQYQTVGIGFGKAVMFVLVLCVLFTGLFIVYKRYLTSSVRHALREEVMLEVRSQMADYAPLDDGPSREMKKFNI